MIRTKLAITDQLSAEVGADYNVTVKDATPQAALTYEVCKQDHKTAAQGHSNSQGIVHVANVHR